MRHAPWVATFLAVFIILLVCYLVSSGEDFLGKVYVQGSQKLSPALWTPSEDTSSTSSWASVLGMSTTTLPEASTARSTSQLVATTTSQLVATATTAPGLLPKVQGETFAVVSRMWRGDLPFLESWLRYYFLRLRVNRIYGIVTQKSDMEPLRALSLRAGFADQLQLWLKDLSLASINTAVFDAAQIPETFVLSVDTDEFVALPVGESLQSITKAESSADVFSLKWRCVPNDTLTEELIPHVGLRCPGVKVMFRTRRFKSFNSPHDIFCGTPTGQQPKSSQSPLHLPSRWQRRRPRILQACRRARRQLVLIHVWYRGVYDAMFRQSAGHTKSSFKDRNTGVEVVIAELRKGKLALRLKHLALGSACQEWLGTLSDTSSSQLRDLYGEASPEGIFMPPDVFINQTEQLIQLDSLGIDEDLRKRAVELYHEFKAVFAKAMHKMLCNPGFFCTRPIMPMISYAKDLTLEFMQNFQGPCKNFTRAV